MRQSQLITNSPRAFIFLQLHLQKHRTAEPFRQAPALWRHITAMGVSIWGAMPRGSSVQRRGCPGCLTLPAPALGLGAPGEQREQARSWAFRLPTDLCSAERSSVFAFMRCHFTKSSHERVHGCPKTGWKESIPAASRSKWLPSSLAPFPACFRGFLACSCTASDSQ